MAYVTDVERGLASPPTKPAPGIKALALYEAAHFLGQVFRQLPREAQALGDWALPSHRTALGYGSVFVAAACVAGREERKKAMPDGRGGIDDQA